ncbi:diacylglycerol kinase family protein [Dyadobacter sp. CY356]|uniref:diacylglycerol/lipid kinase family protein n=1 Tax=Dyadobacter sp. CY356 TaxID=2906442 RepID=UPI001F42DCBB|nr:diacylglycerol kinase family protein [Dyadobacter sp. CY356]MCF0059716.1 diacylglycerol kinase [Dyadobacter sp. CY356]
MLSEQKVLLVVNPISGDKDKQEILSKVTARAEEDGYVLSVFSTTGDDDLAQIRELVKNLCPSRVLVAGGDGTISMVAEALQGQDVIFGIIPAGSANGLSADFGLPVSIEESIEVAFGDNSVQIDAVKINEDISLHLSDIGLNALLVKNYENGDVRGKLGYALEMFKTLNEHENFQVRITTDQGVLETEALVVIIANAKKYGTGISINPFGDMSDGKFELVIAKKIDFIETAKFLTGNTEFNPEVMEFLSVEKAKIECVDREVYFQVDGEYKGEVKELNAEILKGFVRIAIP